jgi:hypothetical protein
MQQGAGQLRHVSALGVLGHGLYLLAVHALLVDRAFGAQRQHLQCLLAVRVVHVDSTCSACWQDLPCLLTISHGDQQGGCGVHMPMQCHPGGMGLGPTFCPFKTANW